VNPKVSIIIPFYNCEFVDQAVNSALNQTYSNVEVVVVDDGSTMHTEKLKPYLEKIKYIKKENGGTATAVNRGIREAKGEYVAWLSSDDFFLPNKLSLQVDSMLTEDAQVSFTNYDIVDKNNKDLIKWAGQRFTNDDEIFKRVLKQNPINGSTVIINKSIYENVDYFNPNFKYTHDYEMWLRLYVKGYKFHYLDKVLLKYRSHDKSGTKNHQSRIKKELLFLRNHYQNQIVKK
jgi:teichuronic acid biosynthesis glycosyltransferase TuaG